MRRYTWFAIGSYLLCLAALPQTLFGQNTDPKAALQERLNSQFKLTKVTANRQDVVTAGSVLVLHKDGLLMCSVEAGVPPTSTYKNGKISMGFGAQLAWGMALGSNNPSDFPQRKFVAGEKFWLGAFAVQDDGVIFQFYSDPYNDVRYYGNLKVPYPKHVVPPVDEMMNYIAEAITAEADENAGNAPEQAPVQAAQPQPTMAPIPPPPPPPDEPPPQPKTIALGQTRNQVVAILGQPQKVVNLGVKEIDYYPDMKVIFVHGKVSDVQ